MCDSNGFWAGKVTPLRDISWNHWVSYAFKMYCESFIGERAKQVRHYQV